MTGSPLRYRLERRVWTDTLELLTGPGSDGLEAVVVWIGRAIDADAVWVGRAVRPRQLAYRGPEGVGVEVPPDSISDLISSLADGEFLAARVHTHPTDAYHSPVDDRNMLISHHGAISIVVPDFAQYVISLDRCSVNELRHGVGWVELSSRDVQERFHSDD